MADNHDQFHEGGPGEFSDETIRLFLFGGLTAAEQPLFEQSLFTDDRLEARVRLAEFDLADDYVFEQLSAPERKLFEERFLLTSNRRQKLDVSKVLRDRFWSSHPAATRSERKTVADSLKDLFGLGRPVWRIAFGVLIIFVLLGTAWLVIKEPRFAERITKRLIPRRSPPPSAAREADHLTNTPVPEHQNTSSPMPVHDQATASTVSASIALTPTASPQTGPMSSLSLPKGEQDAVRLQLYLKPDQTGPFRAEVVTAEGASVFSVDSLKPAESRAEIDFDVPARLLGIGDYQVKLSPVDGGPKESVSSYYFRVQ